MTVCKLPSLLHMRAAAIMEVSGVNEEYKTGTDRYKALLTQTARSVKKMMQCVEILDAIWMRLSVFRIYSGLA